MVAGRDHRRIDEALSGVFAGANFAAGSSGVGLPGLRTVAPAAHQRGEASPARVLEAAIEGAAADDGVPYRPATAVGRDVSGEANEAVYFKRFARGGSEIQHCGKRNAVHYAADCV